MRLLDAAAWLALPAALIGAALYVAHKRRTPEPTIFVAEPAAPRDGARVSYPRGSARILTLPNGQREEVRSVLNIRHPMRFGEFVWNDAGVPAGAAWIRIDLAKQTLSLFRDGHEIGTAVILYGTDGKPTPTGVFPILERREMHISSLYDAAMPYMLRLTRDGVAVHASDVQRGSATHGCIGVPEEFARRMFEQMRRGDLVAILPANGTAVATHDSGRT